jgi:hypothetical protein
MTFGIVGAALVIISLVYGLGMRQIASRIKTSE